MDRMSFSGVGIDSLALVAQTDPSGPLVSPIAKFGFNDSPAMMSQSSAPAVQAQNLDNSILPVAPSAPGLGGR